MTWDLEQNAPSVTLETSACPRLSPPELPISHRPLAGVCSSAAAGPPTVSEPLNIHVIVALEFECRRSEWCYVASTIWYDPDKILKEVKKKIRTARKKKN